jgi:hypothetical protein
MVMGKMELAFLISSVVMLVLFIIVFYKLYKKPAISREHKIVYVIVFPSLAILGCISIFFFQFNVDWGELFIYNLIWIWLFLFMLQDLAGNPQTRSIPFGALILSVIGVVLVFLCGVIVMLTILSVLSLGDWFIPLPILILLSLLLPLLLYLTATAWRKGETQYTKGTITSGGRSVLLIIGLTFGCVLGIAGSCSFLFWPFWIPLHVGIPVFIIGMILVIYCLPCLNEEKRKREVAGFG